MASKDVRAGGAYVEFSLRRKGLERSLREIGNRLKKFGGQVRQIGAGLAAAGAGITAPFTASIAVFTRYGTELDKVSKATRVSVEELSALEFAAAKSGVAFDDITGAVEEFQIRIGEAVRDGVGPLNETFGKLGLNAKEIAKLPLPERLAKVSDALNDINDPSLRQFNADEIFGGDAFRILPLLDQGGDAIRQLAKDGIEAGVVLEGETAEAAKKLGGSLETLKLQVRAIAINVGAALAPALTSIVEKTQPILRAIIDWVKENGKLISTVAAVGSAIGALGVAFIGIGTAIGIAGFAIASLGAVLAAVLSPIGLLVTALGVAGVAFVKFTDTGGRAVDYLKNKFGELFKVVQAALGGIRDAFAAGDIALAAEILWTSLKLVFFLGTQDLIRKAIEIKKGFLVALTETTIGAIAEGSKLYAGLQKVWNNVKAGAKSLWENLKGDAKETFNLVRNQASKAGNAIKGSLDEGFDAEAANAQADKLFVERQQSAQKQRKDALASIEEERKAKVQQIEDEAKAREKAIQSSLDTELDAINKAEDAEKARLEGTLDDLKAKQKKLLDDAAKAAAKTKQEIEDASKENEKIEQKRQETLKLVADGAGITSSFTIRALGADDINKKILKAGEDQVKELKALRELIRQDAGVSAIVS